MDKIVNRVSMATALVHAIGAMASMPMFAQRAAPKQRKPVPMMVTASREEIAAWNAGIEARKWVKPTKLHRKPRGDSGQHPKLAPARAHKQHKHPLRDEHGAYTLVGRIRPTGAFAEWVVTRRVWLAGISAQRWY